MPNISKEDYTLLAKPIHACLCELGRALHEIHEQDLQMIEIMEEALLKMDRYPGGGE